MAYVTCAAIVGGAGYFFWLQSGGNSAFQGEGRGKGQAASKGRPQSAPVTAASVVVADMPVIISAPGTVEPLANVAVKTRTDGQIVEVLFKEGDAVSEGDVLFRLDDRLVKAQIAQAQASIAKDQAGLRDAEATLARREALIGKQVVSEAARDQAQFAVEGLKASIAAGQALLEFAENAARLSDHPRAHNRPYRQPQRQGRRHRARQRHAASRNDQPD